MDFGNLNALWQKPAISPVLDCFFKMSNNEALLRSDVVFQESATFKSACDIKLV